MTEQNYETEYLHLCNLLEREATRAGAEKFASDTEYRREMRQRVRDLQEEGLLSIPA